MKTCTGAIPTLLLLKTMLRLATEKSKAKKLHRNRKRNRVLLRPSPSARHGKLDRMHVLNRLPVSRKPAATINVPPTKAVTLQAAQPARVQTV